MTESSIQNKIIKYLNTFEDMVNIKIMKANINGIPDIQIFYKGKAYFIEVKTSIGTLTESQKHMMDKLINIGCEFIVARNFEDGKNFIDKIRSK